MGILCIFTALCWLPDLWLKVFEYLGALRNPLPYLGLEFAFRAAKAFTVVNPLGSSLFAGTF